MAMYLKILLTVLVLYVNLIGDCSAESGSGTAPSRKNYHVYNDSHSNMKCYRCVHIKDSFLRRRCREFCRRVEDGVPHKRATYREKYWLNDATTGRKPQLGQCQKCKGIWNAKYRKMCVRNYCEPRGNRGTRNGLDESKKYDGSNKVPSKDAPQDDVTKDEPRNKPVKEPKGKQSNEPAKTPKGEPENELKDQSTDTSEGAHKEPKGESKDTQPGEPKEAQVGEPKEVSAGTPHVSIKDQNGSNEHNKGPKENKAPKVKEPKDPSRMLPVDDSIEYESMDYEPTDERRNAPVEEPIEVDEPTNVEEEVTARRSIMTGQEDPETNAIPEDSNGSNTRSYIACEECYRMKDLARKLYCYKDCRWFQYDIDGEDNDINNRRKKRDIRPVPDEDYANKRRHISCSKCQEAPNSELCYANCRHVSQRLLKRYLTDAIIKRKGKVIKKVAAIERGDYYCNRCRWIQQPEDRLRCYDNCDDRKVAKIPGGGASGGASGAVVDVPVARWPVAKLPLAKLPVAKFPVVKLPVVKNRWAKKSAMRVIPCDRCVDLAYPEKCYKYCTKRKAAVMNRDNDETK